MTPSQIPEILRTEAVNDAMGTIMPLVTDALKAAEKMGYNRGLDAWEASQLCEWAIGQARAAPSVWPMPGHRLLSEVWGGDGM